MRFFCIYKWSNVSLLSSDDRLHFFHTESFKIICNLFARTWSDLVDHGPWEGNDFFITYICNEIIIYKSLLLPLFCHCKNRFTEFCTILGTVIHRYQCNWISSCFESFIKHCYQYCHGSCRFVRSVLNVRFHEWKPGSVCFLQSISFFGNCKGYHLKRFACKDLFQAVPLCQIRRLCFYCFCKGSEYFIFTCSVPMQNYAQSQIVIRLIDFIHHIIIERLHTGNATIQNALFQKSVCDSADKDTENVSDSKMHPSRCFFRFL